MLTPTGVTYANYWNAIKAGNPTHVRFTFLGQNIVLEDEDVLLSSGVNLTDMFNGDTDLVFGRTLSKQITVTFINSNKLNGLQWTGEFTLEFGVEINGTTNWVTMGYFSGEKPKNVTSVQTIVFTAYDRMRLFNGLADEFVKSISYPKTVKQIYDALCSYVGLQNVSGDELASIMSRSFSSAPADMQGYSCRDLLGFIAESCGCYAKIMANGKVKLVWFTDNTAHAATGTEEFRVESGDIHDGMTWDEADTYTWDEFDNFTWDDVCGYQEALRVDRLYVKQLSSDMDINYPNSYGDNVYAIVDNPFLSVSTYSDVTTYLAPIYNRLYNFGGYLPVQLECVGNWCVEAGDIITIDVNAQTITFPVFVKTMRWSGAINDSYETTASGKRQIYNSESTKQKVMSSNKIEMYVTEAENEMQTYTDGQVSGAKSYADGKVTDALNTVDQNYYKIRSGISITVDGVTISGSKYINIESGSKIDIKNGADLDVESGGDINLKSGGKINLASGSDIEVNSGGDVNIKSGGNVNVASGGNFNIASGGNMSIHAAGTFELTGGTGSILLNSSGVDITGNKYIHLQSDTNNKWYIDEQGLSLYNTVRNKRVMQFSGQLDTQDLYADAGVYSYNPGGDTTHGRLALVATDHVNHYYGFIAIEYAGRPCIYSSDTSGFNLGKSGNPVYEIHGHYLDLDYRGLQPVSSSGLDLGSSTYSFNKLYINQIYGAGNYLMIYPTHDPNKGIYVSQESGEDFFTIHSAFSSGSVSTWKKIRLYGEVVAVSSRRWKDNIKKLNDVGEIIDKLEPVSFVYKNDDKKDKHFGLIYEDTIDTVPEICVDGGKEKGINYVELVPLLLKEIQDLRKRVSELEKEVKG